MLSSSFLAVSFVASLSLIFTAGCSSAGTGTGTGNTGDAGSAGSGATPDSGGGSTGGGSVPGVKSVACYNAADKKCDIHGDDDQKGIDSDKASCTSDNGMVVDHCPSAGLVGCCLLGGLGTCAYDASSGLMSACGPGGTTWSTTAP